MEQKKYWKGFEELNNTPAFIENKHKEFAEELPLISDLNNLTSKKQASRRDFLKVLGFSLSAATLATSCEIPIKKAIPYVVKPEEILPGIATYYASSFINGSDYCSVLVKTREGRPIKIEGNKLSGVTNGGTSAKAQASVVSLYDGARLTSPKKGGKKTTWEAIDKEITSKLAGVNGDIVILTSGVISPSTRQVIQDFKATYPTTKHVIYEPASNAGMLVANQKSFGKKVIPAYNFEKAQVIVGFDADFLGTWISPVEFAGQYIKNRKVSKKNPKLSKHWQFESYMSMAGSKADKRFSLKPSEVGLAVIALYNEIAAASGKSPAQGGTIKNDKVKKGIAKAAKDLLANKGRSLVVSGSNDANVQVVVNAINDMLNSYGNTIDLNKPYNVHTGDDKAMSDLVNNMNNGSVGAVFVYNTNPAYSYPDKAKFISGLKKVGLTVSFGDRKDETAEHVTYLCPDNHYLESWNDAEPKKGFFSLGQPTIAPLFDTRQAQDSLLTWANKDETFYEYLKAFWQKNIFNKQNNIKNFQAFWDACLHDGIFETDNPAKTAGNGVAAMYGNKPAAVVPVAAPVDTTTTATPVAEAEPIAEEVAAPVAPSNASNGADVSQAASAIVSKAGKASGLELKLYETATMGDGRYSNNPFLQETPEPISKVCWGNFVAVSEKYAKEQGWKERDELEVTVKGKKVKLPLIYQPGQVYGTASIAVGFGRTKSGNEKCNTGENVYPFVTFNGETFDYEVLSGVTLTKVASDLPVARTQTHHTIDDKRPIVRETTLEEYKKDSYAGNHFTKHMKENADIHNFTLYGDDPDFGPHNKAFRQGHRWGMSIDLNTCIGCNACVVACNVENNVPIVGKEEVVRAHEMHWLRIDRYYSGDLENPDVTFMPMMCQHCDNAPCENVCPVAATNHSGEGLNQMAYNRCIGTRYCANNCPFKVRRFNWFDYQEADSFARNTIWDNDEYAMVDDLTRMVLNPDVTVRSRGVMEKCSFCVQRIQEGKLNAKREGRKLKDGDIKTACQQSCPTNAIVFGDANDKDTEVSIEKTNERSYALLEEIHVVPSIQYMTGIRNREPKPGGHGHGHHNAAKSHDDKKGHDNHDGHDHGSHDGHGH